MNFDRLKANTEPIMGQQLLSAEAVKFSPEDYAVLLEQLPLLEQFGFEAEDFGEEFTPELREREERLRAELEKRN